MTHEGSGALQGGTRERWEALADGLVSSALRYASPMGAAVLPPGPASASGAWSDGLEGFARTFLAAAFRVRGAGGADPHGFLERYADGLRAGTDPDGPERWPTMTERRQAVAEAASLAIGLAETRPWLWDGLNDRDRQRIVDWLSDVVGTGGYSNNWIWFQNVIEAFLASVGGPWSQDDLDRNEAIQESLHVGDGWYSDGASPSGSLQRFDYYCGWAWHVYPLLRARILDRPLEAVHRQRLGEYLSQAQHLIGADGAPVLQGRSLTYRFAVAAPFWAGAIAGATPLAEGATRRLATGVVEHFLDAGALDGDGLLPIGWHGEFLRVRQHYTGSGSTYWASKGLLGLLLPADHPEWTSTATEAPAQGTTIHALRAPGWLVSRDDDGVVRLINHGTDSIKQWSGSARADDPFYARVGYSNASSPELAPASMTAPLEGHVALLDGLGRPSHRDAIGRRHFDENVAVSRSRVHWIDPEPGTSADWAGLRRGPLLTIASVLRGAVEARLAWWAPSPPLPARPGMGEVLDGVWPEDEGPWRLRFGGWALPDDGTAAEDEGADARAVRRSDRLASSIRPLLAVDRTGTAWRTGGSPLSSATVTPWAETTAPLPAARLAAAEIVLGRHVEGPRVVAVRVEGDVVRVLWSDGTIDVVPTDGEVLA